jgi:hypothetical protein
MLKQPLELFVKQHRQAIRPRSCVSLGILENSLKLLHGKGSQQILIFLIIYLHIGAPDVLM